MKVSKLVCSAAIAILFASSCNQHGSCPAYQSNGNEMNGTNIEDNSEWVFNSEEIKENNI